MSLFKAIVLCPLVLIQVVEASAEHSFTGDVPHMVEEAAAAGVEHYYKGPWEYFVGGGVASFDCNQDRLPDLFMAGGAEASQLYVKRSETGGALKFEAKDIGLNERNAKKVLGAYPVNFDNDAHMDLVVLRLGENLLLKGGPDCTFDNANRALAFDGGRAWSTAFAATWEGDAKYPTLAFGNYVDRSAAGSPWGTCDDNVLARPQDSQGKLPNYSEPIMLQPSYCSLSILFTDWNRSGKPDLRITNGRQYYRGGQEQLWRIPANGAPRQYSRNQGWKPLRIWGMGIAEADLDQDGAPEYALSSMGDTMLQILDDEEADTDRPTYRDDAFARQMTAHRPYAGEDLKPSTGWHTQFADLNNDTRLDLFIAKGNVEAMPDFAAFDPDNMLMGGSDGKFHDNGV